MDVLHIMNECREGIGMLCGGPGEDWIIFDARPRFRRIFIYKSHEVEHVTCNSNAECTTPNSAVPR